MTVEGARSAREAPGGGLRPARPVRSSDDIVDQIRSAIDDGSFPQGTRLPAERELIRIFNASRSTVREALRHLEGADRIRVRRGAQGGAFVVEPDARGVATALESMIRFRRAGVRELAEFRPAFEADNARLAAQRVDPQGVAELLDSVERWAVGALERGLSWSELVELDLAFHQLVAAQSGNEIRAGISLGLNRAVRDASMALEPVGVDLQAEAQQLRTIAAAIAARDPAGAYAAMLEHVSLNAVLEVEASGLTHDSV